MRLERRIERGTYARLSWPEAATDPEMLAFLQLPTTATWHTKGDQEIGDFSDFFMWYEHGEGSDIDALPEKYVQRLEQEIGRDFEGLVWVDFLPRSLQ